MKVLRRRFIVARSAAIRSGMRDGPTVYIVAVDRSSWAAVDLAASEAVVVAPGVAEVLVVAVP